MIFLIILTIIFILFYIGRKNMPKESLDFKTTNIISTDKAEIKNDSQNNIPNGYKLVRRKSEEWNQLGFTDGKMFPGYGEIFYRKFDIWHHTIGNKELSVISTFSDIATEFSEPLKEINGYFEQNYSRKKGYIRLFTYADTKDNIRWYYGLKELNPAKIITASAL